MESNFKSPAIWVLAVSFSVSISALVIFLLESNLSDETLFLLLAILRYSAFLLCVSSVYLAVTGIMRLINRAKKQAAETTTTPEKPKSKVLSILGIISTVFLFFLSLGIILIDAFILTITGGKG